MGAGCACHVPTPLGRGDRRHVAPALRGRSGQAWPSSAPAAAFVSASTDRGPPVLPWGQLDPGRGRRPGHPHGLPPNRKRVFMAGMRRRDASALTPPSALRGATCRSPPVVGPPMNPREKSTDPPVIRPMRPAC